MYKRQELDGPETISQIRKIASLKNTPAIFITAKIVPPEVADIMSHDAAVIGLIHKPYDPNEISNIVHSLWSSAEKERSWELTWAEPNWFKVTMNQYAYVGF